jgi:Cd2+/Zn2+-exporting ATPase
VKRGNNTEVVHPSGINVGDIIVVRAGEKIALDGNIISGKSFLDTRAITGESVPRRVNTGDSVLSGTINNESTLEIKVTKPFAESTVSKILELVEHAADKKTKSERFITRFARIYTPIVMLCAIAVAVLPPLVGLGTFGTWVYRAVSFLVISCPCALVISIPLGILGGLGGAARSGVLIKGGNFLDDLNEVTTVVFDKTGTLTQGVFEVTTVAPTGISADELLELAAVAEQNSNHPIAKSILTHYGHNVKVKADTTEKSGMGIIAKCARGTILAGNAKLMATVGVNNLPTFPQTTVHIALDKKYVGYILIADKAKDNIRTALSGLAAVCVTRTVMLTGDNETTAASIAGELGLSDYRAELLPADKVTEFENIKANNVNKVAFVGDGINDAPVLASADIGIAMGGIGSDAAIESADIVIMDDDIGKLATAKKIARKTKRIVVQNIVLALSIKVAVMALSALGITSILMAIFADVGVALLAILNATRALKSKSQSK